MLSECLTDVSVFCIDVPPFVKHVSLVSGLVAGGKNQKYLMCVIPVLIPDLMLIMNSCRCSFLP